MITSTASTIPLTAHGPSVARVHSNRDLVLSPALQNYLYLPCISYSLTTRYIQSDTVHEGFMGPSNNCPTILVLKDIGYNSITYPLFAFAFAFEVDLLWDLDAVDFFRCVRLSRHQHWPCEYDRTSTAV